MAIDEVVPPSCFAGASLSAPKGVALAAGKSVTCKFSVADAVIKGTDPKAVTVSAERLVTAKDAKSLSGGGSATCTARGKLATAA